MGKWGGGVFESDLDFEAIVEISEKAGIKLYGSNAYKDQNPPAADFPEKVSAHLNAGAFTKTFDFYKHDKCVQDPEVEGNYYVILLSICAMMVGAKISGEQLEYLKSQYRICGLMKEGIWQVGRMLARYESGTPLLPEEGDRTEENKAREARNKNRPFLMQNHYGSRYFADGPKKDMTAALMEAMGGLKFDAWIPTCKKCHKAEEQLGKKLRHCAKCKKTLYCSKECQKADFKIHKKSCALNAEKVAEEKEKASYQPEGSHDGQR